MKQKMAREYLLRYGSTPPGDNYTEKSVHRWAYDAEDAAFQFRLEMEPYVRNDDTFRIIQIMPALRAIPDKET